MGATLSFEKYERWMVLVHNDVEPCDSDWDAYVDAVKEWSAATAPPSLGLLVLTGGAGPNPKQRARLNAAMEKNSAVVHVALLTDSALDRGLITAVGWVTGLKIKAFKPAEYDSALSYLGITAGPARAAVLRTAVELRRAFVGTQRLLTIDELLCSSLKELRR